MVAWSTWELFPKLDVSRSRLILVICHSIRYTQTQAKRGGEEEKILGLIHKRAILSPHDSKAMRTIHTIVHAQVVS